MSSNKRCFGFMRICSAIVLVIMLLGIAVTIVMYFFVVKSIKDGLTDYVKICDEDSKLLNSWKSPGATRFSVWAFKINNPLDYLLNGSAAVLQEVGPFTYDSTSYRENVKFSSGGARMTFTSWSQYDFRADESCAGCSQNLPVFAMNLAYSNLIQQAASHEIGLLLSLSCSQAQLGAMAQGNRSVPICTATQQNTGSACRCCDTNPLSTSLTCAATVSPTSKAGGLVSWLAKYDGGAKLTSTASLLFPLSDGTYSPLVVSRTIPQTIFGHTSAVLGFLLAASQAGKASSPLSTPSQKKDALAALNSYANVTRDMRDICLPLYCPAFTSLTSLALMKSASCSGVIPSYTDLQTRLGLSESRAKSFRYLEGVDCSPFTVTFVTAAFTKLMTGSFPPCVINGDTAPCCSLSTALGPGAGCLRWVPGLAAPYRTFSAEEAIRLNNGTSAQFTGCASSDADKFQQIVSGGDADYLRWFEPSDPTNLWTYPGTQQKAATGKIPGTPYIAKVSGGTERAVVGTGLDDMPFLGKKLSKDGKPKSDNIDFYLTTRDRALPLKRVRSETINDVEVNRFETDFTPPSDPVAAGHVPMANLINAMYSQNVPIIVSAPYFYGAKASMLNQSDNSARGHKSVDGVTIYRTSDGFDANSALLSSPRRVDESFLRDSDRSAWSSYLLVEPASGIILGAQIAEMISGFTQECNPLKDSLCGLGVKFGSVSRCYRTLMSGVPVDFPCSAYNVFSPLVQGAKILPIGWVRQGSREDGTKGFSKVVKGKFAMDIIVIAAPVFAFLVIISVLIFEFCSRQDASVAFTNTEKDPEEPQATKISNAPRANAYAAAPTPDDGDAEV